MKLLVPSLLILAAIGLFVGYTNPAYQSSKALSLQVAGYDDALTKSQQLKGVRDQLLSKRTTFSETDVTKLEKVLPDNIDNIRFLIDINNIAARHNLSLTNVQLGSLTTNGSQTSIAVASTGNPVGSVDIGFSVQASYNDMLSFLQDIEHSLRLTDVEKLSFSTAATGPNNNYIFTVRTYWLH